MGKTAFQCLTLALTKTFILMSLGNFTQAQVLRVKNGVFRDTTNVYTPSITGGSVVGDALVFGSASGNVISMEDRGRTNFTGGFTLSAEVWFDETPNYFFGMKFGSFCISFMSGGKMTSNWMTFPTEPIFTTAPGQITTYPVGTELLNGYTTLPLKQWVKLEYNYDEGTGITRTKINGVEDRILTRYRGAERVQNLPTHIIKFFENAKNCKVREIAFRTGRPTTNGVPTLTVQANGLPFRNQILLSFDQIDPGLKFPLTAWVYCFRTGALTTSHPIKINGPARRDTTIPMPAWNGSPMRVQVKVAGIERNFSIVNRSAPSPYTGRFPIVAYHAQAQDFKQLASLGFSVVQNDFNVMGSGGDPAANIQRSLDSAKKYNLGVYVVANWSVTKQGYVARFKDHPNLYGWYLADEPGGAGLFDTIRTYNNAVKVIDEKKPTMVMMNNFNRLTGLDCDIIGVDPFPLPNISLRMIDDATKAAIRATNDTKPVLTLMPHYNSLIPNLAELKCMSWLAVIAGAHGIGIFEWDHRSLNTPNGYYIGNNPTQVAIIGSVFNEMRTYDWLLSAKNVNYATGNLAIHACTKTANGKTFLFLANDSRKSETATFVAAGKTISVTMAPYEVKIQDLNTVSSLGGRLAITPENSQRGNWESDNLIQYRINFQSADLNKTGSVKIQSQLGSDVDLNQLALISSSHPLHWEITDELNGKFEFTIARIPHSLSIGPDMTHAGFIEFSVPVRRQTPEGTRIELKTTLFSVTTESKEIQPVVLTYQPEKKEIENDFSKGNLQFYPNPGQQSFWIDAASEGVVTLVDVTGRTFEFPIQKGQNQINTNQLAPGMYTLILDGKTGRWVKQN